MTKPASGEPTTEQIAEELRQLREEVAGLKFGVSMLFEHVKRGDKEEVEKFISALRGLRVDLPETDRPEIASVLRLFEWAMTGDLEVLLE